MQQGSEIRLFGIHGIPEVHQGDDLPSLIMDSLERQGVQLVEGDVFVVTQKVVSKAEGRLVALSHYEPSEFAREFARGCGKDPRHVEAILRETKRMVRMETTRGILICETKHGFICANAGVDESNTSQRETVCLLPEDPDASARRIRDAVRKRCGMEVAVIISDTFGRPWRFGLTNVAIGVAGLKPLWDYRGSVDSAGYELHATVIAIADELAGAAELVMGKLKAVPVVLVRGCPYPKGEGSIKEIVRDAALDLFR